MDCRAVLLFLIAVFFMLIFAYADGRTKKVVIHVPYKVKKIKHTHTVYKTIHHHHTHHDPHIDHAISPSEEHEHFHHMHLHEELPPPPPVGQHTQPIPGIGIPEFLPDVPLDPLDLPKMPRDLPLHSKRHGIPLYRH
ncbi:forkhead box protein B2-like [Galleria mellonella]|uniref:Forkhead box protein B2-like n=1 Tax=Galleria mellonella TaxID=7137 RepID=A0A6J3C8Z8_GALME|nr:forkhead box protein B2-like [Galleria mellonella]